MKLASFSRAAHVGVGIVVSDGVVDIARHLPAAPRNMIGLITAWSDHVDPLTSLARSAADYAIEEVTLLAPVPRPGKVMGIGLNYADHAAEAKMELPKEQLWFF